MVDAIVTRMEGGGDETRLHLSAARGIAMSFPFRSLLRPLVYTIAPDCLCLVVSYPTVHAALSLFPPNKAKDELYMVGLWWATAFQRAFRIVCDDETPNTLPCEKYLIAWRSHHGSSRNIHPAFWNIYALFRALFIPDLWRANILPAHQTLPSSSLVAGA